MKDREKTKQLVLSLGLNGKLFTLDDVINITGHATNTPKEDQVTVVKSRARSFLQRTYASAGLKLRSIGKNTYKVVDESDPKERQFQLNKRGKKLQKNWEDFLKYQAFMLSKGDPIQVEMMDSALASFVGMEVTQYNVQNEKQNQAIPVTPASAKPKKASGQ